MAITDLKDYRGPVSASESERLRNIQLERDNGETEQQRNLRLSQEALAAQAAVQAQAQAEFEARKAQALKDVEARNAAAGWGAKPDLSLGGNSIQPTVNSPIVQNAVSAGLNTNIPPLAPVASEPQVAPTAQQPGMSPFDLVTTGASTQTQVTPGYKPSKEVTNAITQSFADQDAAANLQIEAEQKKAKAEQEAAQERQLLINAQTKLSEKTENDRVKQELTLRSDIDSALKDANNFKIDPDKYFADRGGFLGKIGAALAIGLGAYASATTGGPNYALDIINKAIDRDIDSQKQTLQSKREGVQQLRGTYSDMLNRFGDARMAEQATRAQQLSIVESKLQDQLGNVKGQEAQSKGQALLAQIQQQKATAIMDLEKSAQDKVTVTTQVQKDIVGKIAGKEDAKTVDRSIQQNDRYEKDPQVVKARETLTLARGMDESIKSARAGNAEAANQLSYGLARFFSGPGVLTDNDLKNASVNRSLFSQIGSKVQKGLFGTFSENELQAFNRLIKQIERVSNREIALAGRKHLNLARRIDSDPEIVISDPKELNLALNGPDKTAEEKAKSLGLKPGK